MRNFAAVITGIVCSVASASPEPVVRFPPYLTFGIFIAEYNGTPHRDVPGGGSAYVLQHARGYLAAVADLSEGHTWCTPPAMSSEVVDARVVAALVDRSRQPVSRPNQFLPAGAALAQIYTALFSGYGPCPATARLSVGAFATQLRGEVGPGGGNSRLNQSIDALIKQRYAEGYLGGVIDATQGSTWCAPNGLKPTEVEASVLFGADAQQTAGRVADNAASVLLQLYNAKFPCTKP